MTKHRNIWLALAISVSMVISGCGSDSEGDTSSEEVTAEETAMEETTADETSAAEDAEESAEETEEEIVILEETDSASVSAEDASELLLEWKTTQYFTDEEVAQDDIDKILEAGINTTSSMNGQPWHFTAVTDSEILEEIGGAMSFGGGSSAPTGDFSAEDLPEGFDSENIPDLDGEAAEGEMTETVSEEAGESAEAEETDGTEESAEDEEAEASAIRSKAALGDTPLAIIVSCAEGSELDAGLATQSMFVEARLLGYGAKIVSSPTIVLNGDDADYYKELLGIPDDYSVVAVLLIGYEDTTVDTTADGVTGASERSDASEIVTYIE